MSHRSNLERVLKSGEFAVTAELGPPKSASAEIVKEKARMLEGYCEAANITDCQTAIVRLSSIAAGVLAQNEGLEPVIQMTCRDRNRIGIQADLLGASALGARNLLCLTGDHQSFGNHPKSKNVFDMDSISLLKMVKGMCEGRFECGEEMKEAPTFFIGAAENPFADPFEFRAPRLAMKAEAGAEFIQTQIIYNIDKFKEWMRQVRELGAHEKTYILAGVAPLKSAGMAKYMKKNVPGMDVPDEYIERMANAADPKAEGIQICVEVLEEVRAVEGVSGAHVMAIEWEEAVPEIMEKAGLLPRP